MEAPLTEPEPALATSADGASWWRAALVSAPVRYALAAAAILVAFALKMALSHLFGPHYILFYPTVMVAALLGGLGPGLLATALSAVLAAVWVIPGPMSTRDVVSLIAFASMGTFMSSVAALYRRAQRRVAGQERELARRAGEARQAAALRESEQRYAAIHDHAPFAIALTRPSDGTLVSVNDAFLRLFGFTRSEVIGRASMELGLTDAESFARVRAEVQRHGNLRDFECTRTTRSGDSRHLSISIEPVTIAGEPLVITTIQDITDRKRAEEKLTAERERLAVTLQCIGDAVIATDPNAHVTVFNGVAESLTGWKAEDALGRPLQEVFRIVSEDTRRPAVNPVDRVLREGVVVGLANHTALIARDGSERPIADSGAPIRDGSGAISGVVLVFRDQTEERRAEELLRHSEARYHAVFDQAAVGVALVETVSGKFLELNTRFAAMLGYSRDEALRCTWKDLTHPDDLAANQANVARMEVTREPFRCEKRYLRKDGTVLWGSLTVSPVALPDQTFQTQIAVVEDITERKKAEAALVKNERRFRALIESSTDMMVVLDAEMRIVFWSPSATEQLGWSEQEALGRRGSELVHPDDRAASRETFTRLVGTPRSSVRFTRRQLHRDGTSRVVEVAARNLLHDPAVQGVVANLRDITSERSLEEQFRQSQKLESIGRLAGGVAHDFNNLLTVILSCADTLREDVGGGLQASLEEIEEIRAAGKRASELTRQLLAFARKQVIAPVPLDLDAVVQGSEKLLRRVLGEDVNLVVRSRQGLWRALCDPGQIEQVILNLAVNARDAMRRGGTLTLETENVQVDAAHAAGHEEQPGDYVRLTVRDTGVGMSEEVKAHLFEPFFTTKAVGRGTGLGLATLYGIVKQSGGHIHVESEPGCGATFEVCFPRTLDVPVTLHTPAPSSTCGTESILVVEDDAQVREVTVRALRAGGYDVHVAADPQEALRFVAGELARMRLLVTDVVMPGLDGRALAKELTGRYPKLRVLYVSGYTQDAIAERGVLDSGIEFLAKPFTGPTLLARVRALLDAG